MRYGSGENRVNVGNDTITMDDKMSAPFYFTGTTVTPNIDHRGQDCNIETTSAFDQKSNQTAYGVMGSQNNGTEKPSSVVNQFNQQSHALN